MSTIDRKLTDKQTAAIRNVFTRHEIAISEQQFQKLLFEVEEACITWERNRQRDKRRIIGRTEMRAEIEHLRETLKKLNPSTLNALCSYYVIKRSRKNSKKTHNKKTLLWNHLSEMCSGSYSRVASAVEILNEACNEAIEHEVPEIVELNPITVFAQKAGRPHNEADMFLATDLGESYLRATGKNPGETPSGPFDDFLAAVFNAIDPRRERADFRKLIRVAYLPQRIASTTTFPKPIPASVLPQVLPKILSLFTASTILKHMSKNPPKKS